MPDVNAATVADLKPAGTGRIDHPDTTAQARRLAAVLKEAEIPAIAFGAKDTNHMKLNDNLGVAGDPATKVLDDFIAGLMKK